MVELRRARNPFAYPKIRKIVKSSGGRFDVRNPIKGFLKSLLSKPLEIDKSKEDSEDYHDSRIPQGKPSALYAEMKNGSAAVFFSGSAPRQSADAYYTFFTNRNFLLFNGH